LAIPTSLGCKIDDFDLSQPERHKIAASAQRVQQALGLQVKYGQEGISDVWRLPFLPDLCRYVQIRTFCYP
jgi:hypothetical protein